MHPPHPLSLTSDEFVRAYSGRIVLEGLGKSAGAMLAYKRIFRDGHTDIPGSALSIAPISSTLREDSPEGEVVKFVQMVMKTSDDADSPAATGATNPAPKDRGVPIESVLIPMIGSSGRSTYTLCVSSQIGCAMGCTFCETAQMGLIRSLRPEEIVGQWFAATHTLGFTVKNIVFMGMGEPLDNFDNVIQAIAILKDHNGAAVPISQITVSTVGRLDGIRRLSQQIRRDGWHRLNLALSLNASNDAVRSSIMPLNRKYDMGALRDALLDWPRYAGNKICIEYVLIPGVNDAPEHAAELADFMSVFTIRNGGKPRAVLNLIPYNPRRNSPWPAPDEEKVEQFLASLISLGVFAKRRRTKGRQMMGACGQLGSAEIRRRKFIDATVSA